MLLEAKACPAKKATPTKGGRISMPFWRCNYHVIWATQYRQPVITPEMEQLIQSTIKHKSTALECPILAINGISDHVHVAVRIPPKRAPADWVRQVKGLSAHEVNAMFPDLPSMFKWQSGYGILTFGEKHIPFIVDYITGQKEHHANDTFEPYLERVSEA